MTAPRCEAALARSVLMDYWLAELPAVEEEQIEEHLFECPDCAQRMEGVVSMAAAIRALARAGKLEAVVPDSLLGQFERDGLRLRTYRVAPGQRLPCTVAADDDVIVTRLAADLEGLERVDLVMSDAEGRERRRIEDVPFAQGAREIVFTESGDLLRSFPAMTLRLRLLTPGPEGDRIVGEYSLDHQPG